MWFSFRRVAIGVQQIDLAPSQFADSSLHFCAVAYHEAVHAGKSAPRRDNSQIKLSL